MENLTLLTSKKNIVFNLVKKTNLDPFNFEWVETDSFTKLNGEPVIVSRLEYKGTNFYFVFDYHKGGETNFFSPGENKLKEHNYPGNWEGQLRYFFIWLANLERELSEPDLWNELSRQKISFDNKLSPETENNQLTFSEAEQVNNGIEKIRTFLLDNYRENEVAKSIINEKLDYLTDASKRQGRKDWFHTCIGVMVSLTTALAMAPDQTVAIWAILKNSFSGIIKLIPY